MTLQSDSKEGCGLEQRQKTKLPANQLSISTNYQLTIREFMCVCNLQAQTVQRPSTEVSWRYISCLMSYVHGDQASKDGPKEYSLLS